jgi:hypothetical protein
MIISYSFDSGVVLTHLYHNIMHHENKRPCTTGCYVVYINLKQDSSMNYDGDLYLHFPITVSYNEKTKEIEKDLNGKVLKWQSKNMMKQM